MSTNNGEITRIY